MTEHTQHCDHEEFCRFFFHDSKIAVHDGTPCMRNHDGCAKCSYDSRTSATPAPAPSCEDNGCTDPEACDEICEHSRIYSPAWVKQHDKEEREKVLKTLHHNIDCVVGDPKCANEKQCCECSLAMTHVECHHGNVLDTREEFDGCLIESLRTTREEQ